VRRRILIQWRPLSHGLSAQIKGGTVYRPTDGSGGLDTTGIFGQFYQRRGCCAPGDGQKTN